MKTKPRFLEYSLPKEIIIIIFAIIRQTYELIVARRQPK